LCQSLLIIKKDEEKSKLNADMEKLKKVETFIARYVLISEVSFACFYPNFFYKCGVGWGVKRFQGLFFALLLKSK